MSWTVVPTPYKDKRYCRQSLNFWCVLLIRIFRNMTEGEKNYKDGSVVPCRRRLSRLARKAHSPTTVASAREVQIIKFQCVVCGRDKPVQDKSCCLLSVYHGFFYLLQTGLQCTNKWLNEQIVQMSAWRSYVWVRWVQLISALFSSDLLPVVFISYFFMHHF